MGNLLKSFLNRIRRSPVLTATIVISIIAISSLSFLGYRFYRLFNENQSRLEQTSEHLGGEIVKLKEENELLYSQQARQQKLSESQKQVIGDLQNKIAEQSSKTREIAKDIIGLKTLPGQIGELQSNNLSPGLIGKIASTVVFVECQISFSPSVRIIGSGSIWSKTRVITNAHILQDFIGSDTGASPSPLCSVSFPRPGDLTATLLYDADFITRKISQNGVDVGILEVKNPFKPEDAVNPIPTLYDLGIGGCSASEVSVGDKITVFGYPAYGGSSLTITDGIISGFEDFSGGLIYKTSAKIDKGNSGGIAILNKKQCLIGMPTWAEKGAFEGLGYIQSLDLIASALR